MHAYTYISHTSKQTNKPSFVSFLSLPLSLIIGLINRIHWKIKEKEEEEEEEGPECDQVGGEECRRVLQRNPWSSRWRSKGSRCWCSEPPIAGSFFTYSLQKIPPIIIIIIISLHILIPKKNNKEKKKKKRAWSMQKALPNTYTLLLSHQKTKRIREWEKMW